MALIVSRQKDHFFKTILNAVVYFDIFLYL
jgi:hypothetical protein